MLLDEVDKELEKRGHLFCRYADDCNVYVRSRRAGERVMGLLRQLYAGLHLRVNECVHLITGRSGGRSIEQVCERLGEYLRGWKEYFGLADTPRIFADLDEWIRHRLRAVHLKHWKRGTTIYRELRALGLPKDAAAQVVANSRRWWRNSAKLINVAIPISYFDQLGVPLRRLSADPHNHNDYAAVAEVTLV